MTIPVYGKPNHVTSDHGTYYTIAHLALILWDRLQDTHLLHGLWLIEWQFKKLSLPSKVQMNMTCNDHLDPQISP